MKDVKMSRERKGVAGGEEMGKEGSMGGICSVYTRTYMKVSFCKTVP